MAEPVKRLQITSDSITLPGSITASTEDWAGQTRPVDHGVDLTPLTRVIETFSLDMRKAVVLAILFIFRRSGKIHPIRLEDLYISDNRTLIITKEQEKKEQKSLHKLLEKILSGNKNEPLGRTGKDFIEALQHSPWKDAIRHPFFLSEHNKISFINEVFKETASRRYVLDDLACDCEGLIYKRSDSSADWVKILTTRSNEQDLISSHDIIHLLLDEDPENCEKDGAGCSIHESRRSCYFCNKFSVYDLIRFFRNTFTYFTQQREEVKQPYYLGRTSATYWNFFEQRFPNLLTEIYKVKGRQIPEVYCPTEEKFLS